MASLTISSRFLSQALQATACVNIGAGLGALLMPALFAQAMFGKPLSTDPYVWRYHVALWGFVLVMGLAYALASRNPLQERGLLLAGGLGKTLAAVVFAEMVIKGLGTILLAGSALWDGSFGLLMLLALWQQERSA